MANIKSAMKRAQLAKAQNLKNAAEKSALRTAIRRFEEAVAAADKEKAESTLKQAVKKMDKATRRGLFHKNAVARKKSRMTKRLNALG
ncbi:small subunit ribosomal protein S20 [Desulfitispora alkaliphila]|uniref:30S ribosomal protein S20 n=1 Tax=Desulfitispora alkaliphila TaxID=622674 RepID=UPI003D23C718